jgi:hypothetical protein
MTYTFRIKSASDYDTHGPLGLDRTQRACKVLCCLIGMRIFEERHGTDSAWYIELQSRAIGWASA